MTQTCRPAKCIEAIRIALLDQCTLLPLCGPLNGYAMGCVIDPDWSPEIEEGDESIVKNDCGEICWRDDRCDMTKRINGEFKIAGPDPEFEALIGGDNLIVVAGQSVGVQKLTQHCSPWLFLELFERTDECDTEGDPIYLRHVFPRARLTWTGNEKEGVFRLLQIEFKALDIPVADIAQGPYFDIPAEAIVAPANARSAYIWFADDTVPDVQCGAIEVPCTPPIIIESVTSPTCETICITGSGFSQIDEVHPTGYAFSFHDPNGPNAGENPGSTTILSWTDTQICFTDPALVGTWPSLELYDTANVLLDTYDIDPDLETVSCQCAGPENLQISAPDCGCITITGDCLDNVDQVQVSTNNYGTPEFFDPNGPNAGENSQFTTFDVWDDNTITFCNCQLAGGDVFEIRLYDLGNNLLATEVVSFVVPIPTFTNVTSPECDRIVIEGTCLDLLTQLIPYDDAQNTHDFYWHITDNPEITVNQWDENTIDITDPLLHDDDVITNGWNEICGAFVANNDCNIGYGPVDFPDCITVEPCPFPSITGATTPECENVVLTGHDFDLLNRIREGNCIGVNFYDPAGPDNGLNPGGAVINVWNSTTIDITYPGFCDAGCADDWEGWGVGNTPFYDSDTLDNAPNVDPTCCAPVLGDARSNFCSEYQIILNNDDFVIDHIEINGIDYYDPAGPNNGLNPGGVTFPSWGPTNFVIHDETNLCGLVDGFTLYELGDPVAYPFTGQGDQVYCGQDFGCPVNVDAHTPDCETLCFTADSGLLGVDRINISNMPSSNYYNPAGPNAGLNSATTTILSWTDTEICINDTAINSTVFSLGNTDFYDVGNGRHFVDGGAGIGAGINIQPCPANTPIVATVTSPECYTIDITGEGFSFADRLEVETGGPNFYDPAGPNNGLNPVDAVIDFWTNTHIRITAPAELVGAVDNVALYDTANVLIQDYDAFPPFTIEACPVLLAGESENCEEFVLYGFGFDLANHIAVQTTTPAAVIDYYDPAGPDNGLNPGTATILSWTATEIRILDTQFSGHNLVNVQMWGVGETPDYGVYDLSSFPVDDCADLPAVTGSDSPDCQQLRVAGGRFDLVDHIVVVTDSGTLDYYDPAGPNAGSNPGTAQIIAWTPSNIQIYDTAIGGFTVQTVQLFDVGDVTDYGTFDVADYLIDTCPAPGIVSGNDSGVDTFQIHGTNFDSVNHIRVITLGATADYDYFDPNGPNAAFNPGFVTILSWTDTLIEITHTGIGATITDVHAWGCCGALGDPDYGNFNIPNFVVT